MIKSITKKESRKLMADGTPQKKLYIVLSQTSSIVAKMIKFFTQKEYSHASISLTSDLDWMYSFGRTNPYNPFWGGFVRESPRFGTLKRFRKTNAAVIELNVSAEAFENIRRTIQNMLLEYNKYRYNYIGLFKAGIKLRHPKRKYKYYCSEFVREVIGEQNIDGADKLPELVHPVDFLNLPGRIIYRGRLCDYKQ